VIRPAAIDLCAGFIILLRWGSGLNCGGYTSAKPGGRLRQTEKHEGEVSFGIPIIERFANAK